MELRLDCDELLTKQKTLEEGKIPLNWYSIEIQMMERQIGDMRMLKELREERGFYKEDIQETEAKIAYLKRYVGKPDVKIPGVASTTAKK